MSLNNRLEKYRHPLRKKILYGCAIFSIILCLIMGVIGALNYSKGMLGRYQAYMEGILRFALTQIDTDDLEKCIETGEKSLIYDKTQEIFDTIKENYQVEYIYIVKPLNTNDTDNMMNVMAGATEYEKENEGESLVKLGELTEDAYSSKIASDYLAKMESDEDTITFFQNKTEYGNDYTGFVAISNSQGKHIAVLAVDISIKEIGSVLFRYIMVILMAMVILSAIFMAGIYRWLKDRVITPVSQIQDSAENFVKSSHGQNDPDKIIYDNPNIDSNDEIQALSESIATMASDLKLYMKNLMEETKEKERIGAELSVAKHIQASMLPSIFPPFPDRDEFDIYASMTPAKEVGGDFYDFFLVDKDHLALVIADVSGKGVPASLFMVIAKTLLKNKALTGASPKEILETVNNQLCESNNEQMFVTVWLGIYEISTGKLTAANAGHEYPAIKRADGEFELYKDKHGLVLAGMEMVKYREYEMELNVGDTLFVYTDGVPEATDKNNELFGTQRMIDSLNTNSNSTPMELLIRMKSDIDEFVDGAPQFDDITMLAIKIKSR